MDLNTILTKYLRSEERDIIIVDKNGELLYSSPEMNFPPDIVIAKINVVGNDFDEQEFFDKEHNMYYNVKKTVIEEDGEQFFCYRIIDESEYTLLIKEVASYSKSISDMSKFQTTIMNKLALSYDAFLPGLAEYCSTKEAVMLMEKNGRVVKSTYTSEITRETSLSPDEYSDLFALKRGESKDDLFCILNLTIQDSRCAVLVKKTEKKSLSDPMNVSIHNVVRLFIENSILRDKIVYESEHDQLTGLYNKGKYIALKKAQFGKPDSIAIYNFDVNNLKHINDNYGHEYGDALIIKAAKSIAAVVSDKVFGFRMGGDEYVMVAVNLTREEADKVHADWRAALGRLNESDKAMFCSMACGLAYAQGDFDYEELYQKADGLMYENKKYLKSNGITSHIAVPEEV